MAKLSKKFALELRSLLEQHNRTEKHIGYHILPERLNALLTETQDQNKYTFYEPERLSFFRENVDITGKSIVDIGCNVGYFLFSFLDLGAKKVVGYEGKRSCADFLNKAIKVFGDKDNFKLYNEYFDFDSPEEKFDVALLLNVLHHLGDDYGDRNLNIETAKRLMLDQLNKLSRYTSTLVFQMGFNWKGNRNVCLFEHGTKTEMINFITEGTRNYWRIANIGIAQRDEEFIKYSPISEANVGRDDSLGEFLNRPIFILQSI